MLALSAWPTMFVVVTRRQMPTIINTGTSTCTADFVYLRLRRSVAECL